MVSFLRRTASLLNRRRRFLLYKARIHTFLAYTAHSWISCAASHTKTLDNVQRRALPFLDAANIKASLRRPAPSIVWNTTGTSRRLLCFTWQRLKE